MVFFAVRAVLGVLCAAAETFFVTSISVSTELGPNVALLTLAFLQWSQGISMASTGMPLCRQLCDVAGSLSTQLLCNVHCHGCLCWLAEAD